ncbi:LacI family DNA-binding transcriptional regulator [[Clostridium] fimetarium]|uniref:DNA-binding transcriptional regulator, LacI/PurR family n=1 Tax=[Clostridium] fimetarium TaxID=99656 RepID=A0A1I0Q5R4_9FIRM|nr:LacI family DNA-binding transcriptional regulator [[Clostridium] fimetarium]SEW22289.1 DNA-binding transcriptional regulator, LacI/PurR family [[Clostridium] fimetarium]
MSDEKIKNITIADIAADLGVSKTTVSRAMSGKGRIGQKTRNNVLEYIKLHDYKPNIVAKGLAQSRTYNIGVVMPVDYNMMDLTFFQECLLGIEEIAGLMEYDILLAYNKDNDISSLERIVNNGKVDGVILMRTFINDPQIEFLKQKNIKFVTVGSSNYTGVIQIDHDHKNACKELTSVVLMKCSGTVALLGGDMNHVVSQNRLKGFYEGYETVGKSADMNLVDINIENNIMLDKKVEEALEQNAECILCMDDAICVRVLNKLHDLHKKVPKDVKVASFYNGIMLENYVPSITSLSFNTKELGIVTGRTIIDMIEGKSVAQKTLLPYEIVLKESTK